MKRHMIQRPTFWLIIAAVLMVVNTHDFIRAYFRDDTFSMVLTGLGVIGGVYTFFIIGREFLFWLLMKLYRHRLIHNLEKEICRIEQEAAKLRKEAEERKDENGKS